MDPYVEACSLLEGAGVRYLVVGAFAVNLHAADAGLVIATADCNVLLPADVGVLATAVTALRGAGFEIEAGGEPLPDEDRDVLRGIVRARTRVRCTKSFAPVDLMLTMRGARLDELWSRQRRFDVAGGTLRVAPLEAVLRSKRLANRPKDRAFLEAHADALRVLLGDDSERPTLLHEISPAGGGALRDAHAAVAARPLTRSPGSRAHRPRRCISCSPGASRAPQVHLTSSQVQLMRPRCSSCAEDPRPRDPSVSGSLPQEMRAGSPGVGVVAA